VRFGRLNWAFWIRHEQRASELLGTERNEEPQVARRIFRGNLDRPIHKSPFSERV
jgi:hypothetical protein